MNISVCVPSYKRPYVQTLEYIPFARVYVDHKEYLQYVEKNAENADIVSCPEGVQGSVCRIRNYILDQEFARGMDAVLLVDDDMKGIYFWEHNAKRLLETDRILEFIEKYSLLCREWGAWLWGVNVNQDKQVYMEYTPFSTLSFVGGPFQCFLNDGGLRYDERFPLKEDYDMLLQQLNKHRRIMRVNKFFYVVKQAEQKGGCAAYRNFEREEANLIALQKKWGSNIVKRDRADRSHNLKKSKKKIDFNPIIHAPIKGI